MSAAEVEIPRRSPLAHVRRMGGGCLMMMAIFAASTALFSVIVFIVAVLVGGGAQYPDWFRSISGTEDSSMS